MGLKDPYELQGPGAQGHRPQGPRPQGPRAQWSILCLKGFHRFLSIYLDFSKVFKISLYLKIKKYNYQIKIFINTYKYLEKPIKNM